MKDENNKQQDCIKIIDYIDDMGNKHRIYTDNKDIEEYIKRNYDIVENNPQQNLTQ